jgi:hypothetical protein
MVLGKLENFQIDSQGIFPKFGKINFGNFEKTHIFPIFPKNLSKNIKNVANC